MVLTAGGKGKICEKECLPPASSGDAQTGIPATAMS